MTQRFIPIVLFLTFATPTTLRAQESPTTLPAGLWTGHLTPMNHPDIETPLDYAVSRSAGSTEIQIRGPEDLRLDARDVVVSADGVRFTFVEPEADVPLRCDLRFDQAGALRGRCTDPAGRWASLTMYPPRADDPARGRSE